MDTPTIIIDRSKLMNNIKKMADVSSSNKVSLRPHIKTHKIPYIAKEQLNAGAVGITVAKVSEAEVMADYGINDIFIAYPLVTEKKIKKAIELSKRIRLIVATDCLQGANLLSKFASQSKIKLEVRLEVDTGLRRTGVLYNEALELAKKIKVLPNLHLTGIYTFRGPVLNGKTTLRLKEAGIEEGKVMVNLAKQMRHEGIDIRDVSVGSTPTSEFAAEVAGVTEIRPGTYIFYDAMQEKYGSCAEEECAATVHVTVVSRPSHDLAIIDGGSKTFATDVQPNQPPLLLKGFGKIVGYPNVTLERVTEEHGMLHIEGDANIRVGDVLQIIPNHICSTVNLHNEVSIIDQYGDCERYAVLARGKLQ
ncbi:alanine racemase [Peribacillus simplex]